MNLESEIRKYSAELNQLSKLYGEVKTERDHFYSLFEKSKKDINQCLSNDYVEEINLLELESEHELLQKVLLFNHKGID